MISVVIPTLNAEFYIQPLLERLMEQSVPIGEVIVIDSESTDRTTEIASSYPLVKLISVKREDFNHGGTRDLAIRNTSGEIILMLTQDALPTSSDYVKNLVAPFFQDPSIAMASGRQVPRADASLTERLTREYNYPEMTFIRDKSDLPILGVKTFFSSDCCSAYRRSAYDAIGGFDKDILVNEDMKIAAQFIYGGFRIAYVGAAAVFHSHNYSLKQQFTRNFDVAAFMKMNDDLFANVSATSEGIKMVKWILSRMLKEGHFIEALYFVTECAVKLFANKLGARYKSLPRGARIRFALNKNYWKTHEL